MFRHFGVLNFLVSSEAVPKFKEHNAGELFLCIYFPLFSLWWISLMSQFCAPHGLLGYTLLGVHLGWRANIETAISPGLVFPFSLFFFSGLPSPVVLVLLPSFYFNLIAENGRWMLLLNFSVSVAVDMAICFSIEFFWLLFNNWVDVNVLNFLWHLFWAIVVYFWFLLLWTHLMFQIFLVTPLFNNCLIFSLEIWALED